jgi:hypothetical protein
MAQDAKQQSGTHSEGQQSQPQGGTTVPQQQQGQTQQSRQITDLASI